MSTWLRRWSTAVAQLTQGATHAAGSSTARLHTRCVAMSAHAPTSDATRMAAASSVAAATTRMTTPARSARRVRFSPPTDAQLALLRHRLTQAYVLPPSTTPARSSRASIADEPPRILCLDVGNRYVGVALSEAHNTIARSLTTIYRREDVARSGSGDRVRTISPHSHHVDRTRRQHTDLRTKHAGVVRDRAPETVCAEIRQLLLEHRCVAMVVGMPMTLGYKMDTQCTKTIEFVQMLQRSFLAPKPAPAATRPTTAPAASPSAPAAASSPAFTPPLLFWWDERLSSSEAKADLGARGFTGRKLAVQTDAFAAATILQEFLNRLHLR